MNTYSKKQNLTFSYRKATGNAQVSTIHTYKLL